MEWKLPIVSTDEGGIIDVVEHGINGLVVPCRCNDNTCHGPSATELADALERLIKNPALRHEMGEAGYMKFKKSLTLQAFERKFVDGLEWAMNH